MDNIIWLPVIAGTICIIGSYLGFGLERLFFIRGAENPPSFIFPKKAKKNQRTNLLILGILFYILPILLWGFVTGSWTKVLPQVTLNNDIEQIKPIKELDESGVKLKE
jgi:hypothetical protein